MTSHLRRLTADTAIYGVSTIVGRFLTFLLVPFYTNVLVPGEYGIVTYVFSLLAFLNVVYAFGMESAYFKFASERSSERTSFSTAFISIAVSSLVFSGILAAAAVPIGRFIDLPREYHSIVYYGACVLALDAIAIVPFAALRRARRARRFAVIKLLNIIVTVGMNVVLLVVVRMGIEGIFISALVASVVTIVALFPTIGQNFKPVFRTDLWRVMMHFGLPSIPAGLAAMAVQVIDRPILRSLTDDATVGIYQANYRLGIFMMLIVQMFDYAWRPFFFATANEPHAKEIFSRVLTYFVAVMAGVFIVVTFFIGDVVTIRIAGRHLIHPDYWIGLGIVPIVLLGYLFLGVSNTVSAGLYIEKKTSYLPAVSIIAAGVNIVSNYLLIPRVGMYGAAWATLFAYATMAFGMYILAERVYPIHYDYNRLFKVALVTGMVLMAHVLLPVGDSVVAQWVVKIGLVACFAFVLKKMKLIELHDITSLVARLKNPRTERQVDEITEDGRSV
jgi:O-antigen/teichoic acid export membrane protein